MRAVGGAVADDRVTTEFTSDIPAIVTQGLTRQFGRVTALNNVSLVVPSGTVLGLLGPNGSGKTTLLSILAGFISPTAGTFQLLGQPDHSRALSQTGSLISRPLLWPHLTCRDNLRCVQGMPGLQSDPDEIDRLLAVVGLDGSAASRKFGQCSTGMRQRLGIATALLGNPDLLLLDEPTTGLDPEGMVEVRNLIRELGNSPGRSIIMSSHLLHEVELTCDHYAIIYRGNLVDQGPLTSTPPPATAVQINTTDNRRALDCLVERGWSAVANTAASTFANTWDTGQPQSLLVETLPGSQWKVARDLAELGIYPSDMRPSGPAGFTGSLEEKYLAAVGRGEVEGGQKE